MNPPNPNRPLPVDPTPDPRGGELEVLLAEPFARAWDRPDAAAPGVGRLRAGLLDRARASRAAEAAMRTVRRRRAAPFEPRPGVALQLLYQADPGRPCRPGEPLRARLVELRPGVTLDAELLGGEAELRSRQREWLVLSGRVSAPGVATLAARDYHVTPAGAATPRWQADEAALLFLRESDLAPRPGEGPHTVFDAQAGWPEFAPGIRRRVLWQRDGQAALLYHAQAGASVPAHGHGHDEECLMVQGELFLDDLLLQPLDYQLAPAGTAHRITHTDTGVVIYAHGDLELRFGS